MKDTRAKTKADREEKKVMPEEEMTGCGQKPEAPEKEEKAETQKSEGEADRQKKSCSCKKNSAEAEECECGREAEVMQENGSEDPKTEAEKSKKEETPEPSETDKEPGSQGKEKQKGGFFKKKDKKDKKDEKIEELTEQLQRQMAEFENFRRRTEKEKAARYDMGIRDVVEKLLPVADNFERGLAGADEKDPFAEGMKMVYKQMMTILADIGVKPINAKGEVFDPNLHNAVMHVEDESLGENVVAEELQKGYTYKDQVVRYSMVKVAN